MGSEQQFVLIGSAPAGRPFPYSSIHAMNRVLQNGDQVAVMIEAADPAGYYTHLHRIACIGSVSQELLAAFDRAKEAQKVTLDLLKPGTDPQEIVKAHNEYLRSHGDPERSGSRPMARATTG